MMKLAVFISLCFFLGDSEATDEAYKKLQWTDLIPLEDMKALYEPPEEIYDIPEGGVDDDVTDDVFNTLMQAMDSDYQRALSSTNVMAALNNKNIKIPGFIVPVVIDEDKTTEFFIVPYFGACIHYPPPPPNQTIYAKYNKGYSLEAIYEPFIFSGLLTTSIKEDELATAAYHLKIDQIAIYDEY